MPEWVPDGYNRCISHLGGVPWFEAPRPRRWHRCRPQSEGWIDGEFIQRCACGGISFDRDGIWIKRNERSRR